MEWSERDLHEAGIVTLRRRIKEPPVAQRSDRAEAAHTPHSPIGALDPREIRALIRKVGDLQKAVAQRDALINLYQQRVEAQAAELEGRKRGWFKFFGR